MVQVTGKLTDSGGYDAPNTEIKLVTTQGFGSTLRTAELVVRTGNDASYDFDIAVGKHVIYVKYVDTFEMIGSTTVNSDTPSPMSISEMLNLTEPLAPDEITIVTQLVVEAREAAAEALQSEQNAAASEQEVEADRQEVAANTQTVVLAAAQVDQDKNDVTSMTAQVTSMRDEVETDRAEVSSNTDTVTTLASQVESNTQAVAKDTLETSASAELARRWAEGDTPSGQLPSDANNSYYWAMQALSNANQTFVSGGLFDPSEDTEYPDVTDVERDTIWIISLPDGSSGYSYTSGDLSGTLTNSGDMLFYDTPSDVFILIPTTIQAPDYVFKATEYTGMAGETVLSVQSGYIAQSGLVKVKYNGVELSASSYSITNNGNTITLTDAIDSDSDVITVDIWNRAEVATLVTTQIFNGTTPPAVSLGKDGDVYYQL